MTASGIGRSIFEWHCTYTECTYDGVIYYCLVRGGRNEYGFTHGFWIAWSGVSTLHAHIGTLL
jgi:hypothetical protein